MGRRVRGHWVELEESANWRASCAGSIPAASASADMLLKAERVSKADPQGSARRGPGSGGFFGRGRSSTVILACGADHPQFGPRPGGLLFGPRMAGHAEGAQEAVARTKS